eukprot:5063026-Prymnesium_polylepis.1
MGGGPWEGRGGWSGRVRRGALVRIKWHDVIAVRPACPCTCWPVAYGECGVRPMRPLRPRVARLAVERSTHAVSRSPPTSV